jgi:hypothetical protein
MDNPPEAGLPTSPTPAWTTLHVAHIPTASATAKDFYIKGILKTQNLARKEAPYPVSLKILKLCLDNGVHFRLWCWLASIGVDKYCV